MTKPTIHSNGTSADELVNGYQKAYLALRAALTAVQETTPNGRDYYPQAGDANTTARAEHMSRIERVEAVAKELEDLALHCLDAQSARTHLALATRDASLGVGHLWTNTACPAYRSYDPKQCICSKSKQ